MAQNAFSLLCHGLHKRYWVSDSSLNVENVWSVEEIEVVSRATRHDENEIYEN